MKNLILVFVAIISFGAYSQDSTEVKEQVCNFTTNETDEFTGTTKMILESERFVEFTDSSLIKYYKRKKHQYIELDIYLAKIDNLYALYDIWRIDSKSAYKYFGSISTDAKFLVKFKDGKMLELKHAKYDTGDTNYDLNCTYYGSYIILSDEDRELLATKEIQKIRMYWSKGYEDYDVDNPTLIMNQLNCLK